MAQNKYITGHLLTLIHSGDEYFSELENVIKTAVNTLHLQVYIFDEDTTGKKIIAALLYSASKGVEVSVMVDGFGSGLSRNTVREFENQGVKFRYFSPFPFSGITQSGRRLHHKICVADNLVALLGGINIADKYSGYNQPKAWFDYAVKIEGPVCTNITAICESIWKRRFSKKISSLVPTAEKGKSAVRISRNDWLRRKNQISISYKNMLRSAKSEIIIVASYFIPSRKLLKILVRAAKRGKKVSIILSRKSDVPFIKGATTYLYDKMLESGIRIFEYTESVLHAKVCVVDNDWCTIGSHNLNHLSEFLSVETNVDVLDLKFVSMLKQDIHSVIKNQCIEITLEEFYKQATALQRLIRFASFKLVSWSMWLLDVVNRKDSNR